MTKRKPVRTQQQQPQPQDAASAELAEVVRLAEECGGRLYRYGPWNQEILEIRPSQLALFARRIREGTKP